MQLAALADDHDDSGQGGERRFVHGGVVPQREAQPGPAVGQCGDVVHAADEDEHVARIGGGRGRQLPEVVGLRESTSAVSQATCRAR